MNLIQQLQATPKWKEFMEWYEEKKHLDIPSFPIFLSYDLILQKGVFEKFIDDEGLVIKIEGMFPKQHYCIFQDSKILRTHKSFEELLIWYFNN